MEVDADGRGSVDILEQSGIAGCTWQVGQGSVFAARHSRRSGSADGREFNGIRSRYLQGDYMFGGDRHIEGRGLIPSSTVRQPSNPMKTQVLGRILNSKGRPSAVWKRRVVAEVERSELSSTPDVIDMGQNRPALAGTPKRHQGEPTGISSRPR